MIRITYNLRRTPYNLQRTSYHLQRTPYNLRKPPYNLARSGLRYFTSYDPRDQDKSYDLEKHHKDTKSHKQSTNFDLSDLLSSTPLDDEFSQERGPGDREKQILSKIYGSIASSAQKPKQESTTSVTDLLNQIFSNKPVTSSRMKDPRKDVQSKQEKKAIAFMEPVFSHIAQLPTNKDVIEYYTNVFVPRFTEKPVRQKENNPQAPVVSPETVYLGLEKCMDVLVDDFKDPMRALGIFEHSRNRSLRYFYASCTAGVYNRAINIQWRYYKDLGAVVDLVSDMRINAVMGTRATIDLLATIYREASNTRHKLSGANIMPLWGAREDHRREQLVRYRTSMSESLHSEQL